MRSRKMIESRQLNGYKEYLSGSERTTHGIRHVYLTANEPRDSREVAGRSNHNAHTDVHARRCKHGRSQELIKDRTINGAIVVTDPSA